MVLLQISTNLNNLKINIAFWFGSNDLPSSFKLSVVCKVSRFFKLPLIDINAIVHSESVLQTRMLLVGKTKRLDVPM